MAGTACSTAVALANGASTNLSSPPSVAFRTSAGTDAVVPLLVLWLLTAVASLLLLVETFSVSVSSVRVLCASCSVGRSSSPAADERLLTLAAAEGGALLRPATSPSFSATPFVGSCFSPGTYAPRMTASSSPHRSFPYWRHRARLAAFRSRHSFVKAGKYDAWSYSRLISPPKIFCSWFAGISEVASGFSRKRICSADSRSNARRSVFAAWSFLTQQSLRTTMAAAHLFLRNRVDERRHELREQMRQYVCSPLAARQGCALTL